MHYDESMIQLGDLNLGDRVECYFNLHEHLYSVRALSGRHKGLVVAHTREIRLSNVTLVVQKAGRERVRREKRKTVHAFVRGTWETFVSDQGLGVTYNPYLHESFVMRETGEPIYKADALVGIVEGMRAYLYV